LLDALQRYNGTLVFVSHDRYFIDRLATKVFEVGDGAVHVFSENYEDYLFRKEQDLLPPPSVAAAVVDEAKLSAQAAPVKRVNPLKMKQLQDRSGQIEAAIATLEAGIAQIEREMAVFESPEQMQRLGVRLDEQRRELEQKMTEWEEVNAALESSP